jgi:cell filamentation protein
MEWTFSQLNAEYDPIGMERSKFAERAAKHISEINHIHPFREDNGRTLRAFLKVLARQAGHEINLKRIKPDE